MKRIAVVAFGVPVTQGSLRAIPFVRRAARAGVKQRLGVAVKHDKSDELKAWRRVIASAVRAATDEPPYDGPIGVDLTFYLDRPKSRPKRERFADRKPDVDKLLRAVLDALESVAWVNDSRVCDVAIRKRYGSPPRVVIVARALDESDVVTGDGLVPGDKVYAKERRRRECPG